jgi:polyhydroxyalkanoate synthase
MTNALLEMVLERQRSGVEEAMAAWRKLYSVPRVLEHARANQVLPTPHEVVYEEDSLRLLRYPRETPAAYAEPVLVCYALVNRPYILDLQPDRSVIRQLLGRGFEVYLIDWGTPSAADRSLTLNDYVGGLLHNCAEYVARHGDAGRFHLLGYCMGGTMSTLYAAMHPEALATLSLMAAPLDFGAKRGLLQVWTDPKYFDVDALVDAWGNCPAPFLQAMFQAMKPVQSYVTKYSGFADKMDDDRFVRNYFAMERWTNDNIPVAGETFREFVKKLYQRDELMKGRFRLGDTPIDLGRITCPVLLLTAKGDHLVPPEQTTGLAPHVGSRDVKMMELDAGHVGLAVSSKAHKQFWPAATAWMAERSTPRAGSAGG